SNQALLKPAQLLMASSELSKSNSNLNQRIQESYTTDPYIKNIFAYLKDSTLEPDGLTKKALENFSYKNNIILYRDLVYIPENIDLKLKILNHFRLPVAIMSEQHDERTLDSPVTMTLRDYNELQRMATALTELQSRVDSFPLEVIPTTRASISREPRVSDPEHFDGNRDNLRNFISQVKLVIEAQPS
ncbi:hypothetical protein BB558_007484, partial [Smittium angustum]